MKSSHTLANEFAADYTYLHLEQLLDKLTSCLILTRKQAAELIIESLRYDISTGRL